MLLSFAANFVLEDKEMDPFLLVDFQVPISNFRIGSFVLCDSNSYSFLLIGESYIIYDINYALQCSVF